MKRVIIFSAFYDPYISGAERMVKEVVERLQDRYSFIIVTARQSRRNKQKEIRNKDGNFYIIARVGFGFKFDKYLYPLFAPFYALRYQPKIVHAVMESYAGIALLLYCYLMKLSFVLRLRQKLSFKKTFCILTLQSGDLDLSEKQARIPQWLWNRIHSKPDLIVSIGNSMAERARKLGAKNVRVIPNGVDLIAAESVVAKNLQKQPHRIVCVARLSSEKGLEYLIDAMPEILKEFPDAQLVLVGGGVLHEKLTAYSLQLTASVKFLGNLPHEQTLEEIAKSEVFVLPSLAEGMGIVLVEAQALGVPVIGTDVGGIPDVIEHEKTGLLVPPKDSSVIAKAVIHLVRDHELSEWMAREAKTQLAKFDWQAIAEEYGKIYNQAINK